ncbi:unnamed protein product [Gongylonema pulchrum]|uniref:DUF5641 domain-containing protein n=1 Tax=Gongylonema pulchrum TaxID=637853 RepID=A0A183CWH8_9BILA|nr:unnamed protein product [Gongylonema pulchrum]
MDGVNVDAPSRVERCEYADGEEDATAKWAVKTQNNGRTFAIEEIDNSDEPSPADIRGNVRMSIDRDGSDISTSALVKRGQDRLLREIVVARETDEQTNRLICKIVEYWRTLSPLTPQALVSRAVKPKPKMQVVVVSILQQYVIITHEHQISKGYVIANRCRFKNSYS